MNKKTSLLFYLLMMIVFGVIIYWILQQGQALEKPGRIPYSLATVHNNLQVFTNSFSQHLTLPLPVLLLQIIIIVLCTRFFGFVFNKIGQPAVIGEIVAGIILGPSLLGLLLPGISHFIFPVDSLNNLQFLSQVGLILFMFVIGMEVDISIIRKQAYDAVIISHASIVIPYALGMGLSFFLYRQFAPEHISFLSFALFIGIAMSITAFPVLARIIQERGITKTKLGVMALTCAASDDVTAWCILAALIAIIKAGSTVSILFTVCLVIFYIIIMLLVVRPVLQKIYFLYEKQNMMSRAMMAIVFIVLLVSAYATEAIGIHALFGSFMAGMIMPQDMQFRKIIIGKIEDISMVLLLPLFFVFTGLRTQVGLLNHGYLWITCGWILLVAIIGKFGGSTLAAKVVGQTWKDSLSIGALMNTRGLMELIVLNIGYDLGILSPEIFTMLVLMALITTCMTNPSLDFINWMMPGEKKIKEPGLGMQKV